MTSTRPIGHAPFGHRLREVLRDARRHLGKEDLDDIGAVEPDAVDSRTKKVTHARAPSAHVRAWIPQRAHHHERDCGRNRRARTISSSTAHRQRSWLSRPVASPPATSARMDGDEDLPRSTSSPARAARSLDSGVGHPRSVAGPEIFNRDHIARDGEPRVLPRDAGVCCNDPIRGRRAPDDDGTLGFEGDDVRAVTVIDDEKDARRRIAVENTRTFGERLRLECLFAVAGVQPHLDAATIRRRGIPCTATMLPGVFLGDRDAAFSFSSSSAFEVRAFGRMTVRLLAQE